MLAREEPWVDAALAQALPTASPQQLEPIAQALWQRQADQGLLGLVLQLHRLPKPLTQTLADHITELYKPLRQAAQQTQTQGPANVIQLIRLSQHTPRADLLADLARHGNKPVQLEASLALAEMLLLHMAQPGPLPEPLVQALDHAAVGYPLHQQPALLDAALQCGPDRLPGLHQTLAKALPSTSSPTIAALRTRLQRGDDPLTRRHVFRLGQHACLKHAAQDALTSVVRSDSPQAWADLLQDDTLLQRSLAAPLLQGFTDPIKLWPKAHLLGELPAVAARRLPHWADALPISRLQRLGLLRSLSETSDPLTRLSALRHILQTPQGKTPDAWLQAVAGFAHDPDPRTASLATRRLLRQTAPAAQPILIELLQSPHEPVRQRVADRLAPRLFEQLWNAWPTLQADQRLARAQTLMKLDNRFHARLNARLQAEPLRALQLIASLGQGAFFEPQLLALMGSDNDKAVASSVVALGSAESDASAAALQRALQHADARVRANAIEAIQQRGLPMPTPQLRALAENEANRPRANAIHALRSVAPEDADTALTQMLADERAAHRQSALWVAEFDRCLTAARQVVELAASDPVPPVRQRARHTAQSFIEVLQTTPPTPQSTPASHPTAAS